MSSQTKTSGNGIGFLGLLAIVFITLKLCNVINWSWWWVTSPLWGGVAVHFAIIAISLLVHAIAIIVRSMINKKSPSAYLSSYENRSNIGSIPAYT